MDDETRAQFAEVDVLLAETDRRLRIIAQENAAISEMVEILGRSVGLRPPAL